MYTFIPLKHYPILVIFLFVLSSVFAQDEKTYTIPDSLVNKTDEYLLNKVREHYADTANATIYLSTILAKATIKKDTVNRATMLSILASYEKKREKKIQLIETALTEIENIDHPNLISVYNTAGIIYKDHYLYEKAINNM